MMTIHKTYCTVCSFLPFQHGSRRNPAYSIRGFSPYRRQARGMHGIAIYYPVVKQEYNMTHYTTTQQEYIQYSTTSIPDKIFVSYDMEHRYSYLYFGGRIKTPYS